MAKPVVDPNHPTSPMKHMVIRTINTYIYTILISLVPLVIGTRFFEERGAQLLTTVVGMLVLFALTYSVFWGTAERDRNLVIYGHLKENKLRGLQGALLGMIPLAILVVLVVINAYLPFFPTWLTVVSRILLLPFSFFVRTAGDTPSAFSWLLILVCGWSPFAAWYGYHNGYSLIRLMDKLIYKQKPRNKDKRLR